MWTILKWNWSFSRHSFSIGHRIFLSGTCGKSRSRNVTLKIGVYIDDGIGFWVTLGYAFEHLIADHENLTKIETVATKRFFLESKTVFMSYPQPLWIIIMQIPWENLCCILLCFLLSCKFHTQNRTEIQTHFSMKSEKQNLFWTLICAHVWKSPRMSHFDFLFKLTCLVKLFDRKLEVFKSSPKSSIFGIFNELFGRFSNTAKNMNVKHLNQN